MANQFSIDVDQSNDGIKVVSVPKTWLEGGNTPNWITPVVNYGMTSGGILIPQRVDSEGRPEVTQYGSIVENVFQREVRNSSSTSVKLIKPVWAKGLTIVNEIYGVTGTFEVGEGISPWIFFIPNKTNILYKTNFTRKQNIGKQVVVIYPGHSNKPDNIFLEGNTVLEVLNMPLYLGNINIELNITGTFGVGEGFDCEVKAYWM